jgi:hypothetical protein
VTREAEWRRTKGSLEWPVNKNEKRKKKKGCGRVALKTKEKGAALKTKE